MSKRLMVSIPDNIAKQLEEQARKENRSLSNMILLCIQKYLDTAAK